jgi:hypothetical protein
MTYHDIKEKIVKAKQRKDSGLLNSYPFPFERYAKIFPGWVKGLYYGITASSQVGKTRFTKYLLFSLWEYCVTHKIPFKCFYFALEEGKESFIYSFIINRLFVRKGIKTNLKTIRSLSTESSIDNNILQAIDELQDEINLFLECFTIDDSTSVPFEMYKKCRDWAAENGKFYYVNEKTKEKVLINAKENNWKDAWNYYEENNPELVTVVCADHISLVTPQKGEQLHDAMAQWSTIYQYSILTKHFKFIGLDVQQQSAEKEKKEYYKGQLNWDKLLPSLDGLANNKEIGRNYDYLIGLFNPIRYIDSEEDGTMFRNYDIGVLMNNYRCANIIRDRHFGTDNNFLHLYFDGALNLYKELPKASEDEAMRNIYTNILKQRQK